MARKMRVEFEGAIYHVMCRGDRREAIFLDDEDRRRFLQTLDEACERTGWRVHAYVLMSNHYHWLLETPKANLVRGMHWFQTAYTARFNARHKLAGHLFQGRYKAVVIDPEEGNYFVAVSDYIHLNPARGGLVGPEGKLREYRWSSLPAYTKGRDRPDWLETRVVLGELGLQDNPSGRSKYGRRMETRAREGGQDNDGDLESLRTGWCLGSEAFKQRMLDRLEAMLRGKGDGKLRAAHSDHDHAALRAGRLLECGLREFGLETEALPRMRKSDWRKRVIGWLIRRQTTVPLRWIADHLRMGAVSRVSRLCGDISDLGPDAHRHSLRIEKRSRSKA